MIVVNTSPLIVLGKIGHISLLKKCFKKVLIPKAVYQELTEKPDSPETIALENAINEKWITINETEINSSLDTKNIGKGEKEAISLAKKLNLPIIIDDDSAKTYASIIEVEAHGTLYVLIKSYVKKHISKEKTKTLLESMIKKGFYISTELYFEFLNMLNSIE